jgi:hypothetical protein
MATPEPLDETTLALTTGHFAGADCFVSDRTHLLDGREDRRLIHAGASFLLQTLERQARALPVANNDGCLALKFNCRCCMFNNI